VDIALAEVAMVQRLGVKVETGRELGVNLIPDDLRSSFDAVFLSVGLGRTPNLEIPGEEYVLDGLEYIERSKLDTPST
jgi:dihydropyrimidine dehydrogenase (NAD+) subunit PreT